MSEPAEVYEWRNADGHDAAALRPHRARALGLAVRPRCSASPSSRRLLEARAATLATIEVRRGVEVDRRSTSATITWSRSAAPTATTVTRRGYVVGCDGANSTVRDLLGVGVDDLGFFYDWLIVDVSSTSPGCSTRSTCRSATRRGPPPWCRADPAGGAGSSCACPTSRSRSSTTRRRAWELLEPWDVHPGNARLERHAVYTFQARVRRAVAGRPGASSPATPRTRCRRSRGRACAPASVTPPTWRGSSTSS